MNALQRLLAGLGAGQPAVPLSVVTGPAGGLRSGGWTDLPPAIASRPQHACVFVDLDGTLVEPMPDRADPALLRFLPGAGEALAQLREAGLRIVIVTNQAGIARGYFSRAQFAQLQTVLLRRLNDEFGVQVDDVAVCPHGPDAQGRPACLCRKPAPGMLIRTARAHGLDLSRCFMVGDTLDDVEAGRRAGATALLLDTGGETVWRRSPLREPDAVFSAWSTLAEHVLATLAAAPLSPALLHGDASRLTDSAPSGLAPASSGPARDDRPLDAQAPAPV